MSQKKDSNQPSQPKTTDDSSPGSTLPTGKGRKHRLHSPPRGLELALEGAESEALTEAGREVLEAESAKSRSLPPEGPPPADTSGAFEAQGDLAEATGAFAESVETITIALQLIIGKFDATLGRIERVVRISTFAALLLILVLLVMGWALFRIESMLWRLEEDHDQLVTVRGQLNSAASSLAALTKAQEKTDKKVADVQKKVADDAEIEIVPDDNGGAKVVITPKKNGKTGGKKNGGKKPPVAQSAAPKIEIPIPGAKASNHKEPENPEQKPPPPDR